MKSVNLDSPSVYKRQDPQNMLACLHAMPELCQQAWQLAGNFDLPQDYSQVKKVVILGMGGSAIGGDLLGSLVSAEARIPILVCRDYDLPPFVDADTLVIASSYSGNTEETLTSFQQALSTDAKKLVITTGGKVKEMAEEKEIPVFSFDYKAQPRAALPFSFLPILCFLQRLAFIGDKSADVADTAQILQRLSQSINEGVPQSRNPAKQLAKGLYGKLPVIYGAGITTEVAHRWKTQINENSKAWAFYEFLPELNHNAVVGYQFPAELVENIVVVMLRSSYLHRRTQIRYEVTCQLLERAGVKYQIVDSEGSSRLSQMMSMVMFGDYVSYYLAMLYRIDPSPVEVINFLKEQLAKG